MKRMLVVFFVFLLLLPSQGFAADTVADRVIQTAKQHIGAPYQFGAPLGDTRSFDCSSFSAYVFGQHGIHLPRVSADQARVGTSVSRSNLQQGDLLFYDTNGDGRINHLGIYISANEMIHASSSVGVHITNPFTTYWTPRFVTARRVIPVISPVVQQPTGDIYTVKSGDSLSLIARQFSTTVDALRSHNNLTSDLIFIGQQLRIPQINQTVTQPAPAPSLTSSSSVTHTVRSGDTLWMISRQYAVTVDQIVSWNQLSSNVIHVGQVLRVAPSEQKTYTVKSGDTLWKIATENQTSVQTITDLNRLSSSVIHVGQTLLLP